MTVRVTGADVDGLKKTSPLYAAVTLYDPGAGAGNGTGCPTGAVIFCEPIEYVMVPVGGAMPAITGWLNKTVDWRVTKSRDTTVDGNTPSDNVVGMGTTMLTVRKTPPDWPIKPSVVPPKPSAVAPMVAVMSCSPWPRGTVRVAVLVVAFTEAAPRRSEPSRKVTKAPAGGRAEELGIGNGDFGGQGHHRRSDLTARRGQGRRGQARIARRTQSYVREDHRLSDIDRRQGGPDLKIPFSGLSGFRQAAGDDVEVSGAVLMVFIVWALVPALFLIWSDKVTGPGGKFRPWTFKSPP